MVSLCGYWCTGCKAYALDPEKMASGECVPFYLNRVSSILPSKTSQWYRSLRKHVLWWSRNLSVIYHVLPMFKGSVVQLWQDDCLFSHPENVCSCALFTLSLILWWRLAVREGRAEVGVYADMIIISFYSSCAHCFRTHRIMSMQNIPRPTMFLE